VIPAAMEELDLKGVIRSDDMVLLKPNFCCYLKKGVTTNLEIVEAVIKEVNRLTPHVILGETHSWGKDIDRVFTDLEMECPLVNLAELEGLRLDGPYGTATIPKIALESRIINIPILKTHTLTRVTFGIKNLFGLVQESKKGRYHSTMDPLLLDLLERIRPVLNIMDATYSMDGAGPLSGRIRETGFIVASRDVVALDMACCELVGLDPSEVSHIGEAARKYGVDYEIDYEKREGFPIEYNVPGGGRG